MALKAIREVKREKGGERKKKVEKQGSLRNS